MIASAGRQLEKPAFSTAPESAPAFAPLPALLNPITHPAPEQDAVVDDLDCGQRVLVGSARRDSSNALLRTPQSCSKPMDDGWEERQKLHLA
jgi:hypothetical protein